MAPKPTFSTRPHPEPLNFPPLSTHHRHTLILLHGRGSNSTLFSHTLLSTLLPSPTSQSDTLPVQTLQQHLPTTKFLFPTSLHRRATFANRALISQWFDTYRLSNPDIRPEVEVKGLSESVAYLHGLIQEEVELVGAGNVVVGGLSQGACVALMAGMTWAGTGGLGGLVGLAGRMPLRELVEGCVGVDGEGRDKDGSEDGVVFGSEGENEEMEEEASPAEKVVRELREELDLEASDHVPIVHTPIFMGHGVQDEKVPVSQGRKAVELLEGMRCDVTWREYGDLGHWYHEEELRDVLQFLQEKCGWQV